MMGYGANFVEHIEEESVARFCPKELKAFQIALDQTKEDRDEVIRGIDAGDILDDNVSKALDKLRTAFDKKTGLGLYVGFHSSEDEGDRYDEISGMYFGVTDMYALTKAGKKNAKVCN